MSLLLFLKIDRDHDPRRHCSVRRASLRITPRGPSRRWVQNGTDTVQHVHRSQSSREYVPPSSGEQRIGPTLPLGHRCRDFEGPRLASEDPAPQSLVRAQPRVEQEAVVATPLAVALYGCQRIAILPARSHRGQERSKSMELSDGAQGRDEECAEA